MTADYVRALREERAQYVARGLEDRVAQVDAELARLGASVPSPPAVERPAPSTPNPQVPETSPRKRTAKSKE